MDRIIVYPGAVPQDTDILNTNRNTMIALGGLIQAVLGGATVVDGLAVQPTSPASMNVQVAPGSITATTALDATAYGTLGADTADSLVKMGVNISSTLLALTPPPAPGTSVAYLIEAAFAETDNNPSVLTYYDPANPSVPWLGASGDGVAQPTLRAERVALAAKAGIAALTGTQTAPAADSGFVGLAVVTVAAGDSTIQASAIAPVSTPSLAYKLPSLRPGFANVEVFAASGTFTVPNGVTLAKITVIGGGGAGGLHESLPSGGGGAGGRATLWAGGLLPGTPIAVAVGLGGVVPAAGAYGPGGDGGTSSFGALVSATGGAGGGGGTAIASSAGGQGGSGTGGQINENGSFGTDGIMLTGRGGDGGGPGNGRGSSLLSPGIPGQAPGGGGGGGGASNPGGAGGTGAPGGNGANGVVIVEY